MALEWKDQKYGGAYAVICHGLTLDVHYEGMERLKSEEPHWNVNVFGRRMKQRDVDMENAKARAERIARAWLKEAQDILGPG